MTRLLFLLLLLPVTSFAQSTIDDYVPPAMFEKNLDEEQSFPPLPPRRPDKMNVSRDYVEKLKKREQKIQARENLAEDQFVEQSAQDILEQINPQ